MCFGQLLACIAGDILQIMCIVICALSQLALHIAVDSLGLCVFSHAYYLAVFALYLVQCLFIFAGYANSVYLSGRCSFV